MISDPTDLTGTEAEQQPLLQDVRNVYQAEGEHDDSELASPPDEPLAFKIAAVMYCWFVTGMHVASIGVRYRPSPFVILKSIREDIY